MAGILIFFLTIISSKQETVAKTYYVKSLCGSYVYKAASEACLIVPTTSSCGRVDTTLALRAGVTQLRGFELRCGSVPILNRAN